MEGVRSTGPKQNCQIQLSLMSSRSISDQSRLLTVTDIVSLSPAVGGCLFDEPYSTCGYSQADDDDFNWEQVNTLTKPTSDPWMPSGLFSLLSLRGLWREFIIQERRLLGVS